MQVNDWTGNFKFSFCFYAKPTKFQVLKKKLESTTVLRLPFSTGNRRCQQIEKKLRSDIPNDTTEASFDDYDETNMTDDDKISL